MPDIRPFQGLFYDPAKAGADMAKLVAEPYDKVSEEMRSAYLAGSPYNIVRADLPRERVDQDDKYVTSAKVFRRWLEKGIVRRAGRPAFYLYEQGYELPGLGRQTRRAFVGLIEAREHGKGHVLPHERTFREPKADRMALLEAVHAHFGMVFLLYRDFDRAVQRALAVGDAPAAEPIFDFSLPDGTSHRVIPIEDPAACAGLRAAFRDRTCVIADGHHRFETAIAFRRAHEAKGDMRPGFAYRTAAFVDIEDHGLKVLPTHRLLPKEITAERFIDAARPWLELATSPGDTLLAIAGPGEVRDGKTHEPIAGAFAGVPLRLRTGVDLAKELPEVAPTVRGLAVTILHRLVLEKGFGIEAGAKEHSLGYVRWPEEGMKRVRAGEFGCMAVIARGATPADVLAVAESGAVMPQKSTDFYPKLLSGLIMNDIEDPIHGGD